MYPYSIFLKYRKDEVAIAIKYRQIWELHSKLMENILQSLHFPQLTIGRFGLPINNVTGTLYTGSLKLLDSSKWPFQADSTHIQYHTILGLETHIMMQNLSISISQETDPCCHMRSHLLRCHRSSFYTQWICPLIYAKNWPCWTVENMHILDKSRRHNPSLSWIFSMCS